MPQYFSFNPTQPPNPWMDPTHVHLDWIVCVRHCRRAVPLQAVISGWRWRRQHREDDVSITRRNLISRQDNAWIIMRRRDAANLPANWTCARVLWLSARLATDLQDVPFRSVPFFGRPRSECWLPHHGRTFSVYLCPLSFWLTLPRRVLSTSWCCPSRPCVVFLACVHLALYLALSLFLQATPLFSHGVTIVC